MTTTTLLIINIFFTIIAFATMVAFLLITVFKIGKWSLKKLTISWVTILIIDILDLVGLFVVNNCL